MGDLPVIGWFTLYLVIDIVKVFEISSKHSHTSLVQDLEIGYAKKKSVQIFVRKMTLGL